jgi:hypothetical protein
MITLVINISAAKAQDCSQIQEAVSVDNLSAFRGQLFRTTQNAKYYRSSFSLPRATDCFVVDGSDRSKILCGSEVYQSPDAGLSIATDWDNIIQRCLPDFRKRQKADDYNSMHNVRFERHATDAVFHIDVTRTEGDWGANITITYGTP